MTRTVKIIENHNLGKNFEKFLPKSRIIDVEEVGSRMQIRLQDGSWIYLKEHHIDPSFNPVMRNTNKKFKVKILSWTTMAKEKGNRVVDDKIIIPPPICDTFRKSFTKEIEDKLPKDRIIVVEKNRDGYFWEPTNPDLSFQIQYWMINKNFGFQEIKETEIIPKNFLNELDSKIAATVKTVEKEIKHSFDVKKDRGPVTVKIKLPEKNIPIDWQFFIKTLAEQLPADNFVLLTFNKIHQKYVWQNGNFCWDIPSSFIDNDYTPVYFNTAKENKLEKPRAFKVKIKTDEALVATGKVKISGGQTMFYIPGNKMCPFTLWTLEQVKDRTIIVFGTKGNDDFYHLTQTGGKIHVDSWMIEEFIAEIPKIKVKIINWDDMPNQNGVRLRNEIILNSETGNRFTKEMEKLLPENRIIDVIPNQTPSGGHFWETENEMFVIESWMYTKSSHPYLLTNMDRGEEYKLFITVKGE